MHDQAVRLAHFSDLHLIDPNAKLRVRDWFTKRAIGWANSRLTRHRVFAAAPQICQQLVRELSTRPLHGVIFTGDATTIGTQAEFTVAEDLWGSFSRTFPGVAVPGNHDHYTPQSVRKRYFETTFQHWQQGTRIGDAVYPFARSFGGIWFVCVNSARPNLGIWDSRGQVGRQQLDRLEQLWKSLPPGRKVLVTHYPYCLADGSPEKRFRKLRDVDRLWSIIRGDCMLWLHGHRHQRYQVALQQDTHAICVGSTTQRDRWTYNEYTFAGNQVDIQPRRWNPETATFDEMPVETIKFSETATVRA